MTDVTLTIGSQPLLLVLAYAITGLERKDALRVRTVTEGNDPLGELIPAIEDQIAILFEGVCSIRTGLATTGGGMERVDEDVKKIFDALCRSRAQTPWTGSFAYVADHAQKIGLLDQTATYKSQGGTWDDARPIVAVPSTMHPGFPAMTTVRAEPLHRVK